MAYTFADTTIEAAQANTLAAVTVLVAQLNEKIKADYLTKFNNWALNVAAGRPNGDPPKPPNAFVVGYFDDPTTGPGTAGFYQTVIQWAYPAVGTVPVCDMPPMPAPPALSENKIGNRIYGEWFQSLAGDKTPRGTLAPGRSADGVDGLFLKVGSALGSDPATGVVGGWYERRG